LRNANVSGLVPYHPLYSGINPEKRDH
jgi:hypothetical protein